MKRAARSVCVIALVAAALTMGAIATRAQEQQPPKLRMLLNLDLFRPRSGEAGGGAAGQGLNDSMLEQIRALQAMGYLRPKRAHPDNFPSAADTPASNRDGVTVPGPSRTSSGGEQ